MTDVFGPTLRALMDNVASKGGTVFYDKIRSQSAGTGTTRTSITTTYQIPQRAVEILAVKPHYNPKATIAAVGYGAMFDIQGQSFGYQPMNFFSQPEGANLGALAGPFKNSEEWWEVHIPVAPGDTYDWGVTSAVAVAANAWASVDVMYSTVRTGLPIIYSLAAAVQTITAATAGDFNLPTAGLALPQAIQLLEGAVLVLPSGVQVAGDTFSGDFTIACTAMTPIQQIRVGMDDVPPGVGASFQTFNPSNNRFYTPGLSFQTVSNPVLQGTLNLNTAITNTSFFQWLARFIKAGVVATPPKLGSS